nr:MAG TPA: hypothetical protein [Caudoviricetes sp.]
MKDCYCRFESCYRIIPKQAFVLSKIHFFLIPFLIILKSV